MTWRCVLLFLVLTSFTGCKFKTYDLADEWFPLETISERPEMLAKDTISTTIGNTLYVEKLSTFWARNPEGTAQFIGLMKHEQEHSKRQFKVGVGAWLARYIVDRDFMWEEEQRGYYLALTHPGYSYQPEQVALNMSNYRNAAGQKMVDFDKALRWVLDVRSGQWKPKD